MRNENTNTKTTDREKIVDNFSDNLKDPHLPPDGRGDKAAAPDYGFPKGAKQPYGPDEFNELHKEGREDQNTPNQSGGKEFTNAPKGNTNR